MKILGKKGKIKLYWTFTQTGIIWRFIFGGRKHIIGETRDKEKNKLYLFTLDYTRGKIFLRDYSFEDNNFWVSVEGASENIFFLGRFEKPELPYQTSIIAIDIKTGEKLWENTEYSFLFTTENSVFGIQKKSGRNEAAELDSGTGKVKRVLTEGEYTEILRLEDEYEKRIFENSLYPTEYSKSESNINFSIENIIKKIHSEDKEIERIEYIMKGTLLIFNYYVKASDKLKHGGKNIYINKFLIYDTERSEILYEDILNKSSNFCVPDNFFINNNFLFYIKEKKALNCINLNR